MQDKKILPDLFMVLKTKYRTSDISINNHTIRQTERKTIRIAEHNWEVRIGSKHFPLGNCTRFLKPIIAELDHQRWARFQEDEWNGYTTGRMCL